MANVDNRAQQTTTLRNYTERAGKEITKSTKNQRLITPVMLQRKRARKAAKMESVTRSKNESMR